MEKIIASEEANAYLVRQLQRLRKRRRKFRLPEEDEEERMQETKMADEPVKSEEETAAAKAEDEQDTTLEMEMDEQKTSKVKMDAAGVRLESRAKEESGMTDAIPSDPVKVEAAAFADEQQAMEEEEVVEDNGEEGEDVEEEDDEDDGSTVTRYLVKWRGLPHEECTWECADDIATFQSAIDAFLDLEQLTTTKQPSAVVSKKFRVLPEQPAYLNAGELREYQLEGLNWLLHNWCRSINGILADEMGLGKTIQCIAFLASLFHERHQHGPFLVVVPLSTITAWQREFAKWSINTTHTITHYTLPMPRLVCVEFNLGPAHRRADVPDIDRPLAPDIQPLVAGILEILREEKPDDQYDSSDYPTPVTDCFSCSLLCCVCSLRRAPAINVVLYVGNAASREIIRRYEWFANTAQRGRGGRSGRYRFHVVLTTYEFVTKDKAHLGSVHWSYLMIDEAHRLKDSRSLLYTVLHSFSTDNRLLVTGTPLQNSLNELWCLLHFLHDDKFPSLADFEAQHSNVRSGELADVRSLHDVLQPHLLRRTKKDVLKSLPSKKEKILLVEMSAMQRKYSRWIIARNYRDLNKGVKGKKSSLSNIIVELKKCVNHPYLVKQPGLDATTDDEREREAAELSNPELHLAAMIRHSGKLILLDKLLRRLRETGHRVLIFSQMVKMLNILAEYLRLRGFAYQRLDGGMRSQERQYAMDHFNAPNSPDFCFILSTKAGGLGINLATADTVIIFDSDWNPQNDLQAEARAHRIGQKNTVNIYRFVTRNTVEEDILQRAKQKMILDHLVIQRMDTSGRTVTAKGGLLSSNSGAMFDNRELAKILQFGAEDLFADNNEEDEQKREKSMEEMDIEEILSRADERTEAAEGEGGDKQEDQTEAFLSGFKVASFKSSEKDDNEKDDEQDDTERKTKEEQEGQIEFWQRVIPATLIPAEQLQDEQAPVFLPPRQRRVVQSYNENRLRERAGEERDSDMDEHSDDSVSRGKSGKRRKKRGRGGDDDDGADDGELSSKDVRQLHRYMMYFGDDNRVLGELYASSWKHKAQDEHSKRKAREAIKLIMDACEEALRNPPPQMDEETAHSKKAKKGAAEHDEEDEGGDEGKKKARRKLTIEPLPGVIIHPAELIQRRKELQNLAQLVAAVGDPTKFRVTKPMPAVRWVNCIWKAKQDGMLMYGVFLHGFNAWDAIVDDPKLRLKECITIRRKKQQQPDQPREESKEQDSSRQETGKVKAAEASDRSRGTASDLAQAPVIRALSADASSSLPASAPASPSPAAAALAASSAASSAAADEHEEIRTVKNTQLASRAMALLKAMSAQDDRKKKPGSSKGSHAASHADDKDKKRARQQTDEENDRDSGGREQRKKKPKKEAGKHTTADSDDVAHGHAEADEHKSAGSSKRKAGRAVDRDRAEESAVGTTAKAAKSKGAAKKADNKRIDEMFSKATKTASDRTAKAHSASSPPSNHTAATTALPTPANLHAASSSDKLGKEHRKQNGTSPPSVHGKLAPAPSSSSSSSSIGVSGEDDEFSPALLEWCKAQLSQRVKSELKQLHHFAVSDGGFKAHQAEVKVVLLAVGREVERRVALEKKGPAVRAELERHLWHTVSFFSKMTGPKLQKLYTALQAKGAAAGTPGRGGEEQVKKAAGGAANVGSRASGGAVRLLPRQR